MNLLILGGTQFLGKELLKEALKYNHNITVISLDEPDNINKITWISTDRRDEKELTKSLADKSFDCVIDNIAFNDNDVLILIRALGNRTKRYVLTSSVDIYRHDKLKLADEYEDQKLLLESIDNTYLLGKRRAEQALRSDMSNMEKVILRPCVVTGPYDNITIPDINIGRSLVYPCKIADGNPVLMYENDCSPFSLVYVGDVARAQLLVAGHPDAANQTFNVIGDTIWNTESYYRKLITVAGLSNRIVKVPLGDLINSKIWDTNEQKKYIIGGLRPSSVHKHPIFDNSKLKKLGWSPSDDTTLMKSYFENQSLIETGMKKISMYRQKEIDYVNRLLFIDDEDYIEGYCTSNLSKIAIGTFMGEQTNEVDDMYYSSIAKALLSGINTVDTAINYRNTLSEKVVGKVINDLIHSDKIKRNDVYVITKGGFIDSNYQWRLHNEEEKTHKHSIRPGYINHCFKNSYKNLRLGTIDLYLMHNTEIAKDYLTEDEYYNMLFENFINLEEQVICGKLRGYGIATWEGLRVNRNHKFFIDMNKVLEMAIMAAKGRSKEHNFVGVELPININRNEALIKTNQYVNGKLVTLVEFAKQNNLKLFTSNSAMYGNVDDSIKSYYDFDYGLNLPQKSLLFVSSIPEVTSAIVGMKQQEHVNQAIQVNNHVPLTDLEISSIINKCKFRKF